MKVLAQIRYRHLPGAGWLDAITPEEVRVEFEEPQWGITPGQALVCYEGDRVIGGGWIKKVQGTRPATGTAGKSTVHGQVKRLLDGKNI
jgi:hypothetical protein